MGEKLLKIENLSKSYNAQTQALADVNITLDKGEFVVVIGPSGAGKSTLIRCINRMIEPTEGKIVFDGTEITSMNNRQMRKVRTQIGMIFQNYNLIDRTSVIKNVLHGRLGQMSFWESVFGLYRHDDVDTRLQRGVILTETLDDFGLALRNDHNGLHGEEDDQKNDGSKNIGCY